METKIKRLYQIEPESKHNKLLEELNEVSVEVKNYINSPTDENMELLLNELIDLNVVALQLAMCRNMYCMAEIWAMAKEKVNISINVLEVMKKRKVGYKAARILIRGE